MSIDYNRLRDMVRVVEDHTAYDPVAFYTASDELENRAPELARELLRLHDGVEELSEWVRKVMNLNIDKPQYSAALTPIWFQITDLLNGDTE